MTCESIDAILSYHQSDLCGVTRFGKRLAEELNVPHGYISDAYTYQRPLFNIKPTELLYEERIDLWRWMRPPFDFFLHSIDTDWKARLSSLRVETIYCANSQIADEVPGGVTLFCPGTLEHTPPPTAMDLKLFSVGMAHKFQPEHHEQLRNLLVDPYRVSFSTSYHEGRDFARDTEELKSFIHSIYGDRGDWLGFLSDTEVIKHMRQADFVVCFFPQGARENNTTLLAALEWGCPVITNLDKYSPFTHGVEVYDIGQLDRIERGGALEVGKKGQAAVRERFSWDRLCEELTEGRDRPEQQRAGVVSRS